MKPSSFLVGMLVDPVYFTFESGTAKLVRLEGRVPPKSAPAKGGATLTRASSTATSRASTS